MLASLNPALIVARREIRDQLRDWRIVVPIVTLTLFFPILTNFLARRTLEFFENYGANVIADRFIPFMLMIVGFFPITVSLVIALESFAGESERHSIEPLLSTPLADWQLYAGKLMASLITPLTASYIGIIVEIVGLYNSTEWRAEPMFLVQLLLLTAVQATVMVSGAVVVSTQTTSVRAANLLASFIIIPMALLIQAESILILWANFSVLWWVIIALTVVAGLLVRMGIAYFNREELLGREFDTLNLSWGWRTLKKAFIGQASNVLNWYSKEIRRALHRLRIPIAIMTLLLVAGLLVGADQFRRLGIPAELFNLSQLNQLSSDDLTSLKQFDFFSASGVSLIWLHNLQVVGLASILGVFTFAVLGVLILMLPMALMGFLAGAAMIAGYSPIIFLAAFLLPHGFLEIPAIILSGAAILRLGAIFITPSTQRNIGESWLYAFADWTKIMLAVVVPLFLGASILEVFITPRTALMILGG
jgi:uncharacterized membrane protein SpoIIM required for sporulation/ABC-type transport system involved in multi-copper enzyme maturation permease subunit